MKKFLYIVAGVSLASVIGLANIALADEKDDPKTDENTPAPVKNYNSSKSNTSRVATPDDDNNTPAPVKNWNSSKSNTSTEVATDGDGGGADDIPQGSGDPLKGLNVTSCKNYPKGKCPTVKKPDDGEGADAQKKKTEKDK